MWNLSKFSRADGLLRQRFFGGRKENGESELSPFRESKHYYYYYVSCYYYFSAHHSKLEAVSRNFVYFIFPDTNDYLRLERENKLYKYQ